jgi:hypothetical protein
MNADAKFDAAVGRQAGVALDEARRHFDARHRRARTRRQPGDDPLLSGACECKGGDQALMHVKASPDGGEGGSPKGAFCIAL